MLSIKLCGQVTVRCSFTYLSLQLQVSVLYVLSQGQITLIIFLNCKY